MYPPRESITAPASLRHGLDEVVDDLCWDGHPLLLECMDQLTHVCQGVHSASNVSVPTHPECVQLGLNLNLGDMEGQERVGV